MEPIAATTPADDADALEREGHELLDRLLLVPTLARHGRVEVVGALGMGLVCARDIDLHLDLRTVDHQAWMAVTADLAAIPGVQCLRLHNLWDYGPPDFAWRPAGRPRHRGFLIELDHLRLPSRTAHWHVDLWLLPARDRDAAVEMRERVRAALGADGGLRPAILEMKAALLALRLPRRVPSLYVYLAAIEDGARTLAAVVPSLQSRDPALADVLRVALRAASAAKRQDGA